MPDCIADLIHKIIGTPITKPKNKSSTSSSKQQSNIFDEIDLELAKLTNPFEGLVEDPVEAPVDWVQKYRDLIKLVQDRNKTHDLRIIVGMALRHEDPSDQMFEVYAEWDAVDHPTTDRKEMADDWYTHWNKPHDNPVTLKLLDPGLCKKILEDIKNRRINMKAF